MKKKKGFSLIELIIVLAVMATIALIAIPNFTAVRESSKNKADQQSMAVIERIMLVAEAEIDMPVNLVFDLNFKNNILEITGLDDEPKELTTYFENAFSEVECPQGSSTQTGWGPNYEGKADAYHITRTSGSFIVTTFKAWENP